MGGAGKFISLEGVEGTGKSTQARLLKEAMEAMGRKAVLTAEPGGTPLADKIRGLLLDVSHKGMDHMSELLLYNAARRQHLSELVIPSLEAGIDVITDRFSDSTLAYQGYGRGIDHKMIDEMDRMVTGRLRPHLTLLLDIDVQTGLRRNKGANKVDRLELEDVEFHERVRQGFLELAAKEPGRFVILDASLSIDEMHANIMSTVKDRLDL